LEAAAGIAGVVKIVLQMQHQQIAPSLHSKELNPNIDFGKTPFIVPQELTEWKRPTVDRNGKKVECSRIAGISSFGAGGSNAHLIIEEYIPEAPERPIIKISSANPAVIVLSAKNEERLREVVHNLLHAIEERKLSDTDLADLAYTLQIGREAMEERLAIIVASINELKEKLNGFLEGRSDITDLYRGQC
jgi:polyketide synthase PksN